MVASLYGVDEAQNEIWVFLEQEGEGLTGVSLELLSKGRQLADLAGWRLIGLLLGHEVASLAKSAFAYGADEVLLANHPLLETFTVEAYAHVALQALTQGKPSIFLLGATPNSRDLAGRLAVRLRTGLNADCTDLRLEPENGILVSEVTGFGGGVLALLEIKDHRPQMSTVRPGVFPLSNPDPKRTGKVVKLTAKVGKRMIHTRVIERVVGEGIDLTQAEVLVVGGRGIEGNFGMMHDLAALLGGEVGSTRPPVDEGHIERERMVGQTGVVCRPKVAIVCGVSGAFHFIVGIQEANLVIAINSDPKAPIFEFADYCVVGDVSEVVPVLIKTLRSVREVAHV